MLDESDVQNGRVLVNWQVTSLLILVIMTGFALMLGWSLLPSLAVGLLTVAIWPGLELYAWDADAALEDAPPEPDEESTLCRYGIHDWEFLYYGDRLDSRLGLGMHECSRCGERTERFRWLPDWIPEFSRE